MVVLAVLGVTSAFIAPNIIDWNCRQETRNDFEGMNVFLNTLRLEALSRNRTIQIRTLDDGTTTLMKAYQSASEGKQACDSSMAIDSNYLGEKGIPDFKVKALLTSPSSMICFNADSTATATSVDDNYGITRTCGSDKQTYKSNIFGATGFIERFQNQSMG